jgi:hypothetical protein
MSQAQLEITPVGKVPMTEIALFRTDLQRLGTLAAVLDWLRGQDPPRRVGEIVTQDEYTHDVVVPWTERLALVFDAT